MSTSPTNTGAVDVVLQGDNREVLRDFPDAFFDCCVTSPPYWNLRNYTENPDEIGQERTKDRYILELLKVFDLVYRKLKPTGSLWVNLGDTFTGGHCLSIPDDFDYMMRRTRAYMWTKVQPVMWIKPDGMAESVTRRFSQKFEPMYWYVKDMKEYYFDPEAAKIPVKLSSVQRLSTSSTRTKAQSTVGWRAWSVTSPRRLNST